MSEGEIRVKRGTKIEPEDAAKMDRSEMGVGLVGRAARDVEGQWHLVTAFCPWCGIQVNVQVDENRYLWFTCGWCGNPFRA